MRSGAALIVGCLVAAAVSGCGSDLPAQEAQLAAGAPRDFYSPASESIPGAHGTVIATQPVTGERAIPGARTFLTLYRSVDAKGAAVAASGTLAVPEGRAPVGGWPLIVFAPGTSGVADECAASRSNGASPSRDDQARWIAKGYAVARTDYQGLGTPGPHGYLIGGTEARAMADLAVAASAVDPSVGKRWVAMGHSQGGHAAMFAAQSGEEWAAGTQLLGAVALAPVSHLGEQVRLAKLTVNNPIGKVGTGNIALFVPLLVRGAQTVADVDPSKFLTDKAVALLSRADTGCVGALKDSWGGKSVRDVFTPGGDLSAFLRVLDDNDPSGVRLTVPTLILQGRDDMTVSLKSTDAMVAELQVRGQKVDYRKFDGVDHSEVLSATFADALSWTDTRFGIAR
ncbi:alpha/beta hydrolase family protein [Nocardia camponoti]|uniref:Lipase n=1 Tax=Nocardia camponoti TaxID=1616106 RepID=A0A917VD14_9NOCA|nr:lipase family protein [Nocardia camponoti]GGK64303.1 lipase [Nocardia camponoti]